MSALKTQCHCGAVTIGLAHAPDYLNDCNCSLCRSRGAMWGYFESKSVQVRGTTQTYVRADCDDPAVEIHFCPHCGATTHFTVTESYQRAHGPMDRVGVNMRLAASENLNGIEVRFPDGWNWDGSKPPGVRHPPMKWEDTFYSG